jgi:hypothetical protein
MRWLVMSPRDLRRLPCENLLASKSGLPDKIAQHHQKLTMISKCKCQHCGGNVEFDAAEFELSGETSHRNLGQAIDCPHCRKPTQIYMNKAEFGTPPTQKPQVSQMKACADCASQMSRRALWCPACGSIQRSLFGLLFYIASTLAAVWLVFGILGWLIMKLMETLGAASQ